MAASAAFSGGHHQIPDPLPCGRCDRDRERSAHRPHAAVERQLPDEQMLIRARHHAHRAQNPQSHRQIEPRALLAHVGRRQVDGDRFIGVAEARVDQRAT